ncbi:helicase SKI2W-like [Anneissia japonica]|uniref:helicase SKI2W-like n=1 Tax=Anneissia japonica TaxID=1529436 RepID=UPI00142592A4|nr:helicase SKI2W-like [Anneissia japonica]
MAQKFPFELDGFQKQAILHLENKQSVFVVAHTSAGKTVVAEYAIRLSLKHGTKAIYTSPIKTLSNQKYRDFKDLFGKEHVGLQTGDAQLNDKASCVIMTTEILRSMLYDPEQLHDLEWVIFDEVHYFNDKSRGVVWEEALIMLPKTVNLVLLSATFSNTMEFARWIGKIKRKKIHVIKTEKRPVPLKHYVYTGTEEIVERQLFQTVDVTGDFRNEDYEQALTAVIQNGIQTQAGLPNVKQKNRYPSFVKMLEQHKYLPAIVFAFVRKKCRENAISLQSLDLTDRIEKSRIKVYLNSSLQTLTQSNQQLSQILELSEMLMRGIAYHHSGVLPRMKEIIERLFEDNLVKVLFATETFASGVNMPARTVIFDSVKKFDGEEVRTLNPAEYIQMAGRAGRRGKDDCGFSIILYEESMQEVSVLRSLQQGNPCPVESQFHPKDNMILNLAKRSKFQVEDILRQSFAEYCTDSTKEEVATLNLELMRIERVPCLICRNDLSEYYDMCKKIHSLRSDLQSKCSVGQVVVVNSREHRNVLGIIISKVDPDSKKFKTIVMYDKETSKSAPKTKLKVPMVREIYLPKSDFSNSCDVVELEDGDFTLTREVISIDATTSEQIALSSVVPSSLFTKRAMKMLHRCAKSESTKGEPMEFMNIKHYERKVITYQCLQCKHLQRHYENYAKRQELKEKVIEAEEKLSQKEKENLFLLPRVKKRQKVLKGLDYFNEDMEIQPKGIVACNFSHHEVILTEVIFEGILDDLEPEEIAAVLSCMVYHGKQPSEYVISEKVDEVIENIKSIAERIARYELEYDSNNEVKDYDDQFKKCFADVVLEWASGHSFEEIIHLASENLAGDTPEGEIVHIMQQLIYTCREIRIACENIGKLEFAFKMKVASRMLKRDIVAVPSLYLE